MELRDKVALITGGARRIGRATALRLARAGCHVAVHYLTSAADAASCAALCRADGVRAETFSCDLAEPEAVRRLPAEVVERFGRLDVLINNASIFERMSVDDFALRRWERMMAVNVTAPLLLALAANESFRAVGGGRIINLCDAAVAQPAPAYLGYCITKGALETQTRALARSLATDVTVVGVAPGVAGWPESFDPALRQRLLERIPLGRAGTPEEVAELIHFLLAEGDYISGTIVAIDGGWFGR
ncbi:MAG: 3-oxoacyl-[acyl-carrier-protein] reductase FabG [Phycisphaerae bacterium]|nr:3-oxoacyl-[acyl-carrier-protein] reductase FabG [Phycisphaerae bacterium]